jgi:uncharacterized membrane protein YdjX (TVP38/TMEM64 family)
LVSLLFSFISYFGFLSCLRWLPFAFFLGDRFACTCSRLHWIRVKAFFISTRVAVASLVSLFPVSLTSAASAYAYGVLLSSICLVLGFAVFHCEPLVLSFCVVFGFFCA